MDIRPFLYPIDILPDTGTGMAAGYWNGSRKQDMAVGYPVTKTAKHAAWNLKTK